MTKFIEVHDQRSEADLCLNMDGILYFRAAPHKGPLTFIKMLDSTEFTVKIAYATLKESVDRCIPVSE